MSASDQSLNFQERVEQVAEAVLNRSGSVGPLELFQEMGLLHPVHVEGWRKGGKRYRVLQSWIQVGPEKFQKAKNLDVLRYVVHDQNICRRQAGWSCCHD
jgi:hypothetical protein